MMVRSQNSRRAVQAASFVAALVFALPVSAQLPRADELVRKAVAGMGGEGVVRKHTEAHLVGQLQIPAQGITAPLEIFSASNPDRLLTVIEVMGMGSIRTGYDGKTGWTINPATGTQLITGKALDQLKQQASQMTWLEPLKHFTSLETVEKTTFNGKDAYKVKIVTKTGEEYFEYFDAATSLPIGTVRNQETPQGALEVTSYLEEYKTFDGQQMPTKMRQVLAAMGGIEQVITISSIEFQIADPRIFDLPKEVQALVKQ